MKIAELRHKPLFFEEKAWKKNLTVCGIDEVGRGCLAGPLVVTAAILPKNTNNPLLKDSKSMSEQQREKAYAWITQNCLYSTSILSWHEIDRLNIYQATLRAMKKAYLGLISNKGISSLNLKYILTDAMPLRLFPPFIHDDLEIHNFPKGESISPSIAAASIIAKVTRDRLMENISQFFPDFGLEKHKGYGTTSHLSSINKHGKTILHRKSFIKPSKLNEEKAQKTLFKE